MNDNQPSEVVIGASMLTGETRDVQLSGESSQGQQSNSTTPDTNNRCRARPWRERDEPRDSKIRKLDISQQSDTSGTSTLDPDEVDSEDTVQTEQPQESDDDGIGEEYGIKEAICKNKPLTNSHKRRMREQFTCNFCKQHFCNHGAILRHDPEDSCLCMCQTCCESGVCPKFCPRCNCEVLEVIPAILSDESLETGWEPMTCST